MKRRIFYGVFAAAAMAFAIIYAYTYDRKTFHAAEPVHAAAQNTPTSPRTELVTVPAPPAAELTPPTETLVAVGDVMLSRQVAAAIKAHGGDPTFPFVKLRDILRNADIAFANLETPITDGGPVPTGSTSFHSDPSTVAGLVDAGFDVVSLANNHTPNAGQKGLLDTFAHLKDAGIAYAGAGPDDALAHAPAVVTRKGIRFAFLAYNDHDVVPTSYAAAAKHAGTAFMDAVRMRADVQDARSRAAGPEPRRGADVVIVSMHSGHEYSYLPDASQIEFAHAAIDAGADLVIGHHAHVVQPVEHYKNRLIFYGLGNFVFDQMWSTPTREGLVLELTFTGTKLTDAGVIPVLIEDYAQPNLADAKHAQETLARLKTSLVVTDGVAHVALTDDAPQTK